MSDVPVLRPRPNRMNARSRRRFLTSSAVAIAVVVVLAAFYFVDQPSGRPTYPAITVTNGAVARNLYWNTTPSATSQPLFGRFAATSAIMLNSTQANSTFTMTVSVWGDSAVGECGCGVAGPLLYILAVSINGSIAPGLEPTLVSVGADNFGVNTDPSWGAQFEPWPNSIRVNTSPFSPPIAAFGANGSALVSANLLNETSSRLIDYTFGAPVDFLAQFQPLANGTVALSTFHLSAFLLGLGRPIVASMTLTIQNFYA